jgi:hypothetical protein
MAVAPDVFPGGRHSVTVLNQKSFVIDKDYEWTKDLGQGAYGIVW